MNIMQFIVNYYNIIISCFCAILM